MTRLFPVFALLLTACPGDPADTEDTSPGPLVCEGAGAEAVTLTIPPYVQWVTPTTAWVVWETETGVESRVDFGTTEDLDQAACGHLVPVLPDGDPLVADTMVHEVQLTGLSPETTIFYRAQTGGTTSAVAHFQTAPDPASEAPTRLVAMSDGQRDDSHPDMLHEIVHEGVLDHVHDTWGADVAQELDMVLFAGDLVDSGWVMTDWKDDFFPATGDLIASVPIYTAIGNHEGGSPHYFRYFALPDDGEAEHYYTIDHSSLRVISLDSNDGWADDDQLTWLDGVLATTCDDETIDYVLAQCHHPHHSELWTPGNSDWTGEVVARLEQFSTDCGKPSVHFFGHTHAYSRGQSRDHRHLMVNVASAGGGLDRWGAQPQEDYPEFSVSHDTYGFVVVEVEAGDNPSLTMRRIDRGTPDAPTDNLPLDTVTLRANNQAPASPTPTDPGTQTCAAPPTLTASAFSDPDGDDHQATHWQIAATCSDFSTPVAERWRQRQNLYQGVDLQAGDDLTDETFDELTSGQDLCFRLRYRDAGLVWSAWSTGQALSLPSCR